MRCRVSAAGSGRFRLLAALVVLLPGLFLLVTAEDQPTTNAMPPGAEACLDCHEAGPSGPRVPGTPPPWRWAKGAPRTGSRDVPADALLLAAEGPDAHQVGQPPHQGL